MKNKLVYPPLEVLATFEKKNPHIFENYGSEPVSTFKDTGYDFCVGPKEPIHSDETKQSLGKDIIALLATWRKLKQVYRMSKSLQNMLLDTEDFELSSTLFNYLPFSCFYIELEKDPLIHGIFFQYDSAEECIKLIPVTNEKFLWFAVFPLFDTHETFYQQINNLFHDPNAFKIDALKSCTILAVQFAMYLCAKNCDIRENEEQKKIYRPSKNGIKDKYSEVRKWDVGYRIVNATTSSNTGFSREGTHKERLRPRQHWRKAHWHTYYVGKGRTEKVLKFIAPILVNNINDTLPVVDHK